MNPDKVGKDPDGRHIEAPTRKHSVARSRGQGAEPWPLAKDLIALFSVHKTTTDVARVCGKGRTSLRDYLLLRPELRERCMDAAVGNIRQRPAYTSVVERRADRARRYVLRHQPEQVAYTAVIRRDPCSYCNRPMPLPGERGTTIDHIDPRSRGGDEHWTNYTGACDLCNGAKNGTPLLQFMLSRVSQQLL